MSITKSSGALKLIGEVSEELNIPQHVLRFWEQKFLSLIPIKIKGRRYYSQENIKLIKIIQELMYSKGLTKGAIVTFLEDNKLDIEGIYNKIFDNKEPSNAHNDKLVLVIRKLENTRNELMRALGHAE